VIGVLLLAEQRRGSGAHDGWRNLQIWVLQFGAMMALFSWLPGWSGPALIDGAKLPFWAGFLIVLLVRDGGEFLYHYAQHRIPFLWAMHSLHHSDPNMAVLTTQRHYWADPFIKQVTIWSAALMIITPTAGMYAAYGLLSLWNLFTHADLPIDFGRWSWVINSPAYHRRHHSILREHYDQNFAALFPIFDLLCGTYRRPDGYPQTGLERRPQSLGEVVIWPLIWDRPEQVETPLPSLSHMQP
jgi:sterol desaturase/sphingolipid hydroxylase (fatty acid hydroxylase superfamily)